MDTGSYTTGEPCENSLGDSRVASGDLLAAPRSRVCEMRGLRYGGVFDTGSRS